MKCYLNQFRPLAYKAKGRVAISQNNLAPFLDASCRREPDFDSDYPPITALCRCGKFAPRLREGDIVAYITANFSWPQNDSPQPPFRCPAEVHKSWCNTTGENGIEAHRRAAKWYEDRGLAVPNNCMLPDNPPKRLDESDRFIDNLDVWGTGVTECALVSMGTFMPARRSFCELYNPPQFGNEELVHWFGRRPGTRNPGALLKENFAKMLIWLSEQPAASNVQRLESLIQSMLSQASNGEL